MYTVQTAVLTLFVLSLIPVAYLWVIGTFKTLNISTVRVAVYVCTGYTSCTLERFHKVRRTKSDCRNEYCLSVKYEL